MKPTSAYDEYSQVLQHLTDLHIEWRNAEYDEARERLYPQISACRDQLIAITKKLISEDVFADGNVTNTLSV